MKRSKTDVAFIYVLGMVGGPSKIGHSLSPESRKKQFERMENCKLVITGTWDVGLYKALATERYIHWLLRSKHIRGEWFSASQEEIVEAIEHALSSGFHEDYIIPAIDHQSHGMKYGQHISTKFPDGTKERIAKVIKETQCNPNHASFIREAVEKELDRREKLAKLKAD